jgi:hypothetical protein
MKQPDIMSWPGRLFLFLLIQFFNFGIFIVGLSYISVDFTEKYLIGKQRLFDNWIFPTSLIIHGITAPIALLLFSILVLFRIEQRAVIHRLLGKVGIFIGFFLLVPSGIGLSYFAMGGKIGKFLFFFLSCYTAFVLIKGYVAARKRRIDEHQYWMRELLLLLCSAIILRLLLGISYLLGWKGESMYFMCSLLSWAPWIAWMKFRAGRLTY